MKHLDASATLKGVRLVAIFIRGIYFSDACLVPLFRISFNSGDEAHHFIVSIR
jgi:hypothetical protein